MSMETGRWFGPGEMAKRLGVTPKALRIRKRLLNETDRLRNRKRQTVLA